MLSVIVSLVSAHNMKHNLSVYCVFTMRPLAGKCAATVAFVEPRIQQGFYGQPRQSTL
jgi:hypothetical protein